MTTPNFFIVGAPKCGTTTLAAWLADHPQVFMSKPKEPHYFNFDMGNREFFDWDEYCGLFMSRQDTQVAIGEASTWYLFSRDAVDAIERSLPGARYVVMIRDHVSMVRSLYLHNVRHLHEDAPSIEQAWDLQASRSLGICVPKHCRTPEFVQYKLACSLGLMITRLLSRVPSERVLLVHLADLKNKPADTYRSVLDFLGVADDGRRSFRAENPSRLPRSLILQRALMIAGKWKRALGVRRQFGLMKYNEKRVQLELSQKFTEQLNEEFSQDKALLDRAIEDWAGSHSTVQP